MVPRGTSGGKREENRKKKVNSPDQKGTTKHFAPEGKGLEEGWFTRPEPPEGDFRKTTGKKNEDPPECV